MHKSKRKKLMAPGIQDKGASRKKFTNNEGEIAKKIVKTTKKR